MTERDSSGRIRDSLSRALDRTTGGRASRLFRIGQRVVIILGLALVVIGTEPAVAARFDLALTAAVVAIALLFLMEYAARIWLSPYGGAAISEGTTENALDSGRSLAGAQRWHWLVSPLGLIDLAAAVAIPLALALGLPHAAARLLGIIWSLKLIRYTSAFGVLSRVVRNERQPLASVAVLFLVILLVAATAAYILERDAQPGAFGSIPAALWWAITTLTTTGYGDEVPITVGGRLLGGTIMICGIGMFALWAGILANGFAQEVRRHEFLKTWNLVAHMPLFHTLGAEAIAAVARLLRPQQVERGRVVVSRGQPSDSMYFVAEGEVKVHAGPHLITMGPGSFFGEMALITGDPRNATVVTTKPTTLLRLDVADFRGLAADIPELMETIHQENARRSAQRAAPPT